MSSGVLSCPESYVMITTSDECKKAATELGISEFNGAVHNDHKTRMPYCWLGSSQNANFNENGDNGGNNNYKNSNLVCKRGMLYSF